MKIRILFILFFGSSPMFLFGQENINQFDQEGKKHGKWTVYLNDKWKEVKESSNANYYRFTFYDHGVNIYPMGPWGGGSLKLELQKDKKDQNGRPTLLDGEYKWIDKKGKISSIHNFQKGEYISCKEFYSSGELHQHFDYTKKCEGQEHGWTVYIYDKKGNIKLTSPTCKDKDGNWTYMRD